MPVLFNLSTKMTPLMFTLPFICLHPVLLRTLSSFIHQKKKDCQASFLLETCKTVFFGALRETYLMKEDDFALKSASQCLKIEFFLIAEVKMGFVSCAQNPKMTV